MCVGELVLRIDGSEGVKMGPGARKGSVMVGSGEGKVDVDQ